MDEIRFRSGAASQEQAAQKARPDGSAPAASQQDIDEFESIMQQSDEAQAGQDKKARSEHDKEQSGSLEDQAFFKQNFREKNTANDLSSIFSSLISGQPASQNPGPTLDAPAASAAASAGDPEQLQQMCDKLIDRILVSDPRYSQGSEVRITLSAQSGFAGDEIVLRRDLQGMLAVQINCRRQDSFKKFVELRPLLTEGLQQYESRDIRVSIVSPDEQPFEDGDDGMPPFDRI